MHIAMYSPLLPSSDSANGIVTYVRVMKAALKDSGHRVTAFHGGGIEHDDGRVEVVSAHRAPLRRLTGLARRLTTGDPGRRSLAVTNAIERIQAKDPIDLVELEETFGTAGHLGVSIPVVTRLHGPHLFGRDIPEVPAAHRVSEARIAAERAAIVDVAGVTCPSARMMAATFAHYGVAPPKATPIHNPIAFVPGRDRWSVDGCDPDQLLFVGRFDKRKGADVLLAAFEIAVKRRPALKLVMCGPDIGISDNDDQPQRYEEYVKRHLSADARQRIRFVGLVDQTTIGRLRRESSLAVSTSRFEVLAYSVTEAMALGMPVLISDTFGASELIEQSIEGFVTAVGDPVAAAEAIIDAMANRKRLAAVAAAGRALVERVLAPDVIAAQTLEFYRSVLR